MGSSSYCHSNLTYVLVALVATAVSLCCADYSRATYYGSPDSYGNPSGACGFGEYGRKVNNGAVSGVSRLYRNGTGCGACYQVRCKIPTHCSEDGTNVVVTDYGEGDNTDFVMSVRAYTNLARPNMAAQLMAYGVVDVEYRRIPCRYGYNLMVKIHEKSNFPNYLAIFAIYQAGIRDIIGVQILEEGGKGWRDMRRAFGAVWGVENPSVGAAAGIYLRFKVVTTLYDDVKWVQAANAVPTDWKVGVAYDTDVQLD